VVERKKTLSRDLTVGDSLSSREGGKKKKRESLTKAAGDLREKSFRSTGETAEWLCGKRGKGGFYAWADTAERTTRGKIAPSNFLSRGKVWHDMLAEGREC